MFAPCETVSKIPLNSFADAAFKCFLRSPAEFTPDFVRVDGIAQIMSGTVGHECYLFRIGFSIGARLELVKNLADLVTSIFFFSLCPPIL